jgi:hypothetical protein
VERVTSVSAFVFLLPLLYTNPNVFHCLSEAACSVRYVVAGMLSLVTIPQARSSPSMSIASQVTPGSEEKEGRKKYGFIYARKSRCKLGMFIQVLEYSTNLAQLGDT